MRSPAAELDSGARQRLWRPSAAKARFTRRACAKQPFGAFSRRFTSMSVPSNHANNAVRLSATFRYRSRPASRTGLPPDASTRSSNRLRQRREHSSSYNDDLQRRTSFRSSGPRPAHCAPAQTARRTSAACPWGWCITRCGAGHPGSARLRSPYPQHHAAAEFQFRIPHRRLRPIIRQLHENRRIDRRATGTGPPSLRRHHRTYSAPDPRHTRIRGAWPLRSKRDTTAPPRPAERLKTAVLTPHRMILFVMGTTKAPENRRWTISLSVTLTYNCQFTDPEREPGRFQYALGVGFQPFHQPCQRRSEPLPPAPVLVFGW